MFKLIHVLLQLFDFLVQFIILLVKLEFQLGIQGFQFLNLSLRALLLLTYKFLDLFIQFLKDATVLHNIFSKLLFL